MFANLIQLLTGRPSDRNYDLAFVKEVEVTAQEGRSRRSEKLLCICWLLIGLKCAATVWLIETYHVPFSAWWIIAPTLGAAAICTGIYLRRP